MGAEGERPGVLDVTVPGGGTVALRRNVGDVELVLLVLLWML